MSSTTLNTDPNFEDADHFYAQLTEAHRTLSPEESERMNARLVLLLANHIGTGDVLSQAISIAADLD